MQDQAAYPLQTTRIGSNARYIHTANHPEWYEIAARAEDGLIAALNKEQMRRDYLALLSEPESETPFHAFGFAIMQNLRTYCRSHLPDRPEMVKVFDNAVATVHSNLTGVIFRDPEMLLGAAYPAAAFDVWAANLEAFAQSDVFTYRPDEEGLDVDGVKKPIIEMCPVPRLGRHLIVTGYELLRETVINRQVVAR